MGMGFESREEQAIVLVLGLAHSSVRCELGIFPQGLERQKHEADHSPPSSTAVKNGRAILAFFHMSS
jgi:hypothetical protein